MPSASIGSCLGVASQPPTPRITDARAAEKPITGPSYALEDRKTKGITTYKASAWYKELIKHDLEGRYPSLVEGIIHGFHLGIQTIDQTYTPQNHTSINFYHNAYVENIDKEFQAGRYFGPYSRKEVEALIGPFQSSPLSLCPKPDKPDKFRAVHDFSYPHNSTTLPLLINSNIDAADYPCTWGTFEAICLVIAQLPPGSQASVRDVATAYRTIPAHQTQWPGLVIQLKGEDSYAINTHNNFGLTSAGGVYGLLADAGADIFRANGIGPLSKWVDDHIFFRIRHTNLDSYNMDREKWKQEIKEHGGKVHMGSWIWFRGKAMPNGKHEELDEDCSAILRNFPTTIEHPPTIAIMIGERWRAWRLVPGWKGERKDIGWAEVIGFEFLVKHIMQTTMAGAHVKVYGDNIGVVEGWWTGRSRNRQVNLIFRRIHGLLQQHNGTIYT